jgi:hypothetical protein
MSESTFVELGRLSSVGPIITRRNCLPSAPWCTDAVTGPLSLSFSFSAAPSDYWILAATGWAGPTSTTSWGPYQRHPPMSPSRTPSIGSRRGLLEW